MGKKTPIDQDGAKSSVGRRVNLLRGYELERLAKPGFYADGGGLYLQVTASGSRSWIYRYRVGKKLRDMGLGPLRLVPLATARDKALQAARRRLDGHDPIDEKRAIVAAAQVQAARTKTFWQVAEAYVESKKAGWKNEKSAAQWISSLTMYAKPIAGDLPVSEIDTAIVMKILDPIWRVKTETASRVRSRIELILDYAKVSQYRAGENPARWRGHLDMLLPKKSDVVEVEHHAALPWMELPDFWNLLVQQPGNGARALQLSILCCVRTMETLEAPWSEIDFDSKQWVIPKARMKAKRNYRIALSEPALAILRRQLELKPADNDFIFPSTRKGCALSNAGMSSVLDRMNRTDITVHGFRSTFRDWAGESEVGSQFSSELAELTLAHKVGSKTVRAYRRGDGLDLRYKLMNAYADFATGALVSERRSLTGEAAEV